MFHENYIYFPRRLQPEINSWCMLQAGSCSARSPGLTSYDAAATLETCSLSTIVPLAQETLLSSSILESIEQKGGSVAMEIDFYATIQRIFCRVAQRSSGDSWYVDTNELYCIVFKRL